MLEWVFVSIAIVEVAFRTTCGPPMMEDDKNITLNREFHRRDAAIFNITCEMFGEHEGYSVKFERSSYDQFSLTLTAEKNAQVFSYIEEAKTFFEDSPIYIWRDYPASVGTVRGCKNCNLIIMQFEDLSEWRSCESPVSFTAKIEQTICPTRYWYSVDLCRDNAIEKAECAVSQHAITLYAAGKRATES